MRAGHVAAWRVSHCHSLSHVRNPASAQAADDERGKHATPVQHRTMSSLPAPFTAAHRSYVKSLYRRILNNELNWIVQRDLWRARALAIRAEFERNRCACTVPKARARFTHDHVFVVRYAQGCP